jgi:hypothetical protein
MREVSLYLAHGTYGASMPGGPNVELLHIYLVPKNVPFTGPASLMLKHIDISYNDSAYPAHPIDADVSIEKSVAAAWINYYSVYDVNRDGKVTLADVDLVRRNMGKDPTDPAASVLVKRSDVNRDGKIDLLDLAAIIGAYEGTL